MIGNFGYSADVLQLLLWLGQSVDYQREQYQRAYEEIQHNLELMKPGMAFREITQKGFKQPEKFQDQHYSLHPTS